MKRSLFQKRHYQFLARALAECARENGDIVRVDDVVKFLMPRLRHDNARFDPARFWATYLEALEVRC